MTTSVGSNVASAADGEPLPVASTIGVPRSMLRAVTVQLTIVSPEGGVKVARTSIGALTRPPSIGDTHATVGTGPVGPVTLIVTTADADTSPWRSTAT